MPTGAPSVGFRLFEGCQGEAVTAHHVFRLPLWLRLLCAVPFGWLAGGLVVGGLEEGGWLLVLCLAGASATVALTVRSWLVRVDVAGHEVTIVNLFRTLHVPWAEVTRFGYDQGLWVRRRSGRQHAISAFPGTPGQLSSATRRGEAVAQQLETIRTRRYRRD